MILEHDTVPRDAEVVRTVIDDRNVTVKAIASRIGCDDSTVYRYLAGERTMPSIVIRTVFELTGDKRLIEIVCGPVMVDSIVPASPAPHLRIPPVDQLLEDSARIVQSAADCLPYMGKILRDNRVDESDRNAIAKFDKIAADVNLKFAQTSAALHMHLSRSTKEAV